MPNGNAGTFGKAEYVDLTKEQLFEDYGGKVSKEVIARVYEDMKRETIYRSAFYQVAIDKSTPHGFNGMIVWHLSIKRIDKEPIMDWRDVQDIKNKLVGPEYEAIQLFPAESRLVDTANQYHIYAFLRDGKGRSATGEARKPPRIPVGWTTRTTTDEQFVNGKQRVRGT